jgi:hypothetical protein
MKPLLLDLPSEIHREMFQLGLEDAKQKYGSVQTEEKAVFLFYQAAKYLWERLPDEKSEEAMMGLLTIWQRDYCGIGADLTDRTLAIH